MIDCGNCIHVQMCKWCDEMVKTHTCDYYETCDSFEPKRPQGEWISCKERLPEEHGYYIVTTDGSHNDVIDIAEYGLFWHNMKLEMMWNKASKILAWMPLPEPYKKEGDEK